MSEETGALAIEVSGASRYYTMGETTVRAVDDVSFTIARGDFAALLGPSGSGKSTLLNLMAGLDRLSAGSILVAGRDLSTMDSEALARHRRLTVGMIFQSFNLVPTMTLADNIELPLRFAETPRAERRDRVLELLTNVGLAHRARPQTHRTQRRRAAAGRHRARAGQSSCGAAGRRANRKSGQPQRPGGNDSAARVERKNGSDRADGDP